MIIQRVIKGIGGITPQDVDEIFRRGIKCRWWQNVRNIPSEEIRVRLTERNLTWHQNHYDEPDPPPNGDPFYMHTPFISTTAGTVEREVALQTNLLYPAWLEALRFATNFWQQDGYLFYCYVFILGRKAVGHMAFAEELRELNIYTGFSPFQPEGEVTAKIMIPPAQIEKVEYYPINRIHLDFANGRLPVPDLTQSRPCLFYLPAEDYHNIRDYLS